MIIYGWKEKSLASQLTPYICNECPEGKMVAGVLQRYAHIYFVPLFPLYRRTLAVCTECRVIKDKQLSDELAQTVNALKKSARTPVWTFAGTAIILMIALFAHLTSRQDKGQLQAVLNKPQAGDVLLVKKDSTSKANYAFLKILNVEDEDITLIPSAYAFNETAADEEMSEKSFLSDKDFFMSEQVHVKSLGAFQIVKANRRD